MTEAELSEWIEHVNGTLTAQGVAIRALLMNSPDVARQLDSWLAQVMAEGGFRGVTPLFAQSVQASLRDMLPSRIRNTGD